MGTNGDYFRHYRFADRRSLEFRSGQPFADLYDTVLGADVAEALGYRVGDPIVIAHGTGDVSFAEHEDKPFKVVGILAKTGTPVDRTIHVSLEAITAIHIDWQSGMQASASQRVSAEQARAHDLTPQTITAFMVGMRDRVMTFTMQRAINDYREEPLLAILPGVTLTQLWELVGVADTALMIVAAFVVLAGLLGMVTAILTSLNERRREMAILRSVGAQPRHVFSLMVAEAGLLSLVGIVGGVLLMYLLMIVGTPILEQKFGIVITPGVLSLEDAGVLGAILACALLMGLLPAARAYRNTLSDGLQIRI
jgi:putative ABC transport system permease protein